VSVAVVNEQEAFPLDEERLRGEIETLAGRAGYEGELTVAVVTDAAIRDVNRRFLDHDYATDVIAFPLEEGIGEVVVSAERALAVAAERDVAPMAELMLYVVHGILHLVGYDDHEPEDARRMHEESLKLLRSAGYRNTIPPEEARGHGKGE
jgi:probable rRNA maturation factor